jgi:hypothetical protein
MRAIKSIMATTTVFAILASGANAQAEVIKADQAMVILAKSLAADSKCNFLSSVEHDELSNLVARAELSLAQKASVAVATTSLAQGKKAGQGSTCNADDRAEITEVLSAAKTAAAQAPVNKAEEKPMAAVAQLPVTKAKEIMHPVTVEKPMAAKKLKLLAVANIKQPIVKKIQHVKLQTYSTITAKYYLERRCGTMGAKAINALYQDVVSIHRSSLHTFGRGAVAAAMHRAEAQARSQSCN